VPADWDDWDFDERLSFTIKESGINAQFTNALRLLSHENTLLTRFENLVGPRGGGDRMLQKIEISKLATFLGLELSSSRIDEICNSCYGKSHTFRTGQIGGYKKRFKPFHHKEFMEAFKDVLEPMSEWYDFTDSAQICREEG
jgi:hypothetical protein